MTDQVAFEGLVNELRAKVADSQKDEVACGRLLRDALRTNDRMRSLLIPTDLYAEGQAADFHLIDDEVRLQTGRLDLQATFSAYDGDNRLKPYVVIWELKAPQCAAYCHHNNSRWRGTSELLQAEEQLLLYVSELKTSGVFHSAVNTKIFGDQVRPGGIIIGRDSDTPALHTREDVLYTAIKTMRSDRFHSPNKFRVFNWNGVLRFLDRK